MDALTPIADTHVWFELSAAQRAVWLDLQLLDQPLGYQLGGWARIDGGLDLDLARQAVSLVMARHDALRLRIDARQPRQRLEATAAAPITVTDLSTATDAAFEAFAAQAFAQPLPLGDEPLFRVDLLRAGAGKWYALWRCHHLICDAISVALALQRWTEAYNALTGEGPAEIAPPTSFIAGLAADLAYQDSPQCAADLAYWRKRFAQPPEPLFAPGPIGAPAAAQRWQLAGAEYAALVASCRAAGLSTQRALYGLLSVLLARLYGRRDMPVGLALHRRDYASRDVVGMLAGVLPVRCEVDPLASLAGNLRQIGAVIDRDFRHQRVSVDALARALGRTAGSGGQLFDVIVSHLVDDAPPSTRQLPGGMYRGPEMMPLALHLLERPRAGTLDFELGCHPAFVDADLAPRLAEGLRLIIAAFLADPDQVTETFDPLAAADRAAVISTWNATNAAFPALTLPALFAAQVARTPDAEAVVEETSRLTYAELDAESDALATRLPSATVIGVALPRSIDTVIALLAILKAGATYLPIDVNYPPERIAFMLADAGATTMITEESKLGALPQTPPMLEELGAEPLDLIHLRVGVPRALPTTLQAWAGSRGSAPGLLSLAYIIYTSGSTGTPKGVGITHEAAANLAFARRHGHDPIGPGDRVLASISVSFDVSVGQLLLPLLSGACVVIAPDLRTLSAAAFWDLLIAQRISHLNSGHSFIDSVLDDLPAEGVPLKRLMLGGEVFLPALARRLRRALPHTEIVNIYGPTETCIDATAHLMSEEHRDAPVPIGRPLKNYRAYVLDSRMRPVPPGIGGMLYLGGPGLARGYIGQPRLTAERFVADPFGPPGGRLYCTGDRAKWRGDGSLSFLGRNDGQMKIRGFRIEPGEIEAALCTHPQVSQAAVAARPDPHGSDRLVGYVVPTTVMPPAAELRAHLAARLPPHMVPSVFVPLEALPVTRNAKLDRRALPPPAWSDEASDYVPPATALEKIVADMFARLLGVQQVGASDDFFALGGHSLLATRLVSMLRAECDVDLPLRVVFAAPTVAALADWIAGQSPDNARAPLIAGPRPEHLPLSFGQERLWFLDQIDPEALNYVMPAALRLSGALDANVLEAALIRVAERHEALRTRFATHDGRAVQLIAPLADLRLECHDLTQAGEAGQAREVAAQIAASEREPFVLTQGGLLRARLLRLAPERHVLIIAIHHIIADGWSIGVLLNELSALYAAFLRGLPDPLPKLPLQYADYALWQRAWLTGPVLQPQLDHWRAALAGAPETIALPLDRPRPPVPSGRGAMVPWRCPPALARRLHGRARDAGATVFMLLLSAFQALLARWSGQRDIVVGAPIAQRPASETEPLIGFFVNTLALRADCSGRFQDILARGRETILAAYAHQDLPFEKLVEALQPTRVPGVSPLVQVMFVLQNMPLGDAEMPGLRLEPLDVPVSVAKFDLSLVIEETAGHGWVGRFEYATDIFDAATISSLARWFTRLLTAIAEDPSFSLDDFDLLGAEERRALGEWNATETAFPTGTLPALFAEQVARTPDAPAVIEDSRTLSYAELDEASDALAALLQPETVIGVALPRSVDTVIAILGILKAGCVYLPLDLAYPAQRIALMIQNANAKIIITEESKIGALPQTPPMLEELGAEPLDLIHLRVGVPRALPPTLQAWAGSRGRTHGLPSLAYIIYTSGSTGTPKPVGITHAAAANLAFARRQGHDPIGSGDRVLASLSVGFDVSVGQLLLPLLSGACVVIAPDLRTLSAAEFWALLVQQRITHLNSVPSFIESVLDEVPEGDIPLKRLMLGGETFSPVLAQKLRRALPGVALFNMYGPTETCIDATAYQVGEETAPLPIGRPLANYRAYVLDRKMRQLPPGVAGTLYLGGPGVARGYVGRPGLTAERFVADPFGPPGARLYCTGDRASWRSDGQLMFLGRDDGQVKLRGFRIELGEIENALRSHAQVVQAAAAVRGARLVGYIVAPAMPDATALAAHLAERLPAHMVPSVFVPLDALPVTANAKLDRNALPDPPEGSSEIADDNQPVGAREAQFCSLFAELTGAPAVGRHDGFFTLGGDSINAIRLVSLARSRCGLAIQVREVFAHPTPAALAVVAREAEAARASTIPAEGPLLPTPLQHAWLASGAPIRRFNQAVALHPPAGIDADRIKAALAGLTRIHAALRLCRDGETLRIAEQAPPPKLQRLTYGDPAELAAPVAALSETFDLAAGITLAALWATPPAGPPVLFLAIHHFAVDGVSWRILLEDLALLCAGGEPEPASLPLRAWTMHLHQQAALRGPELSLWQAMLAGSDHALPTDTAGDPVQNTIGAQQSLSCVLPAEQAARLVAAQAVYRAETNDLLLAALGIALAAWHRGQPVHVVAVEGHGRETGEPDLDLSRTVGWLTSLFPVRLDLAGIDLDEALAGGAAAGEAIKRVKATLRQMPDHGLGYGLLRHLNPTTAPLLAELPQPRLLFNYLGRFVHAAATDPDQWRPALLGHAPADDDTRNREPILLEANALLDGTGALHITWTYAPDRFNRSTVAALGEGFLAALTALACHCNETPLPAAARLIPADFPLATGLDAPLLATMCAALPDLESVVPLTPMQLGLAFESLMRLGDAPDPYHVQGVLRLEGRIDPAALGRAWRALLQRHEVLRLALPQSGLAAGLGVLRPADSVLDWQDLDWQDLDWQAATPADAETRLAALLDQDRADGFDLSCGRLLRARLIRRSATSAWFVLSNHHALLDGWSMPVLIQEWFRLAQGETLPPTLPWHAYLRWLATADRTHSRQFWTAQYQGIAGDAGALLLPTPRTRRQGAAEVTAIVPPDTTRTIAHFARQHGLTLATVTMGAWALILRALRANPGPDLLLGVTSSGRPANLAGSEFAVGLFIQTLPLRVKTTDAVLTDWLHALQTTMSEQEPHGWLGLPDIRQAARLPADRPPFEALFVFENYPLDETSMTGEAPIRLVSAEGRDGTHYPLALAAMQEGETLRLRLGFDQDVIGTEDAQALVQRMLTVLTHMSAPGATLHTVPLLDLAEQRNVLAQSGTVQEFPIDTLPALFAAQVERTPDAEAVTEGARRLTYAELAAESDALAARLPSDTVIGVALPRSIDTVIALLAILKANSTYLPIDLSYPAQRIAFMLNDTKTNIIITEQSKARALPQTPPMLEVLGAEPLDLIHLRGGIPKALPLAGSRGRAPGLPSLAYIIYTSGSTGTPKGVGITHEAAAHLAFARRHGHDPIGPGDRVLASISVGFDVSVGQLLLPLLAGACVVIAPDLRTLSAAEFWSLLLQQRISHLNSGHSFIDSVLDDIPQPAVPLKRLMLGGEVFSPALARRLRAALPHTQIINIYGPTEACIDATAYPLPDEIGDDLLPIGQPLANYRTYVLDARLRPVPPGVPGMLYLGGPGLARGYVGQPRLTAERFIADPFGPPGSRLYYTGDRARWRHDGLLEFLGRTDGQVKIRGFRIELGEIEAALCTHPAVAQAAVAAKADPSGAARLVGYVVAHNAVPEQAELRTHLAERLPPHMVPAVFISLAALPVTANAKLDRNALPAPPSGGGPARLPRNTTEYRLQHIWQEVLGVPEIGPSDDFFEIGGNSLLAIRLTSAVNAAFCAQLPVATLFTHRTIEAMADSMAEADALQTNPHLVTLRRGSDRGAPIVVVHPQGGTVFCYGPLIRHLPSDIRVYGLQAAGLDAREVTCPSVPEMAADYVAALREAQPSGPYRLVGYSFGGSVAFEMARLLTEAGERVALLAMLDTWCPVSQAGRNAPPVAISGSDMLTMLADDIGLPEPRPVFRSVAEVYAAARQAGRVPPGFSLALAERMVSVMANNARIAQAHEPKPGLNVRLLQVRALRRATPASDWTRLITGAVETHDIDCTHADLISPDHAAQVAALLNTALAREETPHG